MYTHSPLSLRSVLVCVCVRVHVHARTHMFGFGGQAKCWDEKAYSQHKDEKGKARRMEEEEEKKKEGGSRKGQKGK